MFREKAKQRARHGKDLVSSLAALRTTVETENQSTSRDLSGAPPTATLHGHKLLSTCSKQIVVHLRVFHLVYQWLYSMLSQREIVTNRSCILAHHLVLGLDIRFDISFCFVRPCLIIYPNPVHVLLIMI